MPQRSRRPSSRTPGAVYLETLGNPNCDIPNIEAIAAVAHRHGLPLVIDNTFGTPYWVKVIPLGADIVVHSATKFLGGHGTTLGGIIVDAGMFDWAASGSYPQLAAPNPSYHGISFVQAAGKAAFVTYVRAILLRDTGATISPFNAFLLLQGIETLSLRLDRHAENTKRIVSWLAAHPQVARVNHPSLPDHPDHALYQKYFPNGGGSIFTFEIAGGEARGAPLHRPSEDLLPAGQRRGRQEPRHPPGHDDALPAHAGGAARSGHPAEHHPPVHRHGACR